MTKDWVHEVGHFPVCQILLQIVVRTVITSSPPAWTSSAGMLATPADFPFFNDCTAASSTTIEEREVAEKLNLNNDKTEAFVNGSARRVSESHDYYT